MGALRCQTRRMLCRSKMRMSGLCKVEMSGFIQGGRRDGTGANRVERERTGTVESFTASRRRPSKTNRSGPETAFNRPAGAAFAGPAAQPGRSRNRASIARSRIEPEDSRVGGAACPAPLAPGALCGFRSHAGGRTSGASGHERQPRNAAEMDERMQTLTDIG